MKDQTEKFLEILKNNSVFWSKLGWVYDPPRTHENGAQIAFFPDSSEHQKYHRDFFRAGIRIHSGIISSGWVDTHRFDYAETDRTLDEIFACGDEKLLYLPRVKLNVPIRWGKENPEEICLYYPGNLTPEEIAENIGTLRHDFSGMDQEAGYTAGRRCWQDKRPNMGGILGNQSFASKKWLEDAGEALRRFVRHLEESPYAERIVGYHIAYGMCGETSLWRAWEHKINYRFGDYGYACRRAFYDWGLAFYGSVPRLEEAWNTPGITRDNIRIPPPNEREFVWESPAQFFRAEPEQRMCMDYERFMSDVNADALEHFAKTAKQESGKPVGAFYGYYMYVPRAAYTGHLAYERILNSPYIDFLASPKSYRRVEPGEPGSEQVPSMSIGRKKLYIDELDNRTHLSGEQSENMFQTRGILWREFAKNMMNHANFWWMDLKGGWFDSPEILHEIARIEETARRIRPRLGESVSEILLVTDENSFYVLRSNDALHRDLFVDTPAEIRLCGAPVDHLRLHDLTEIGDLTRYRCVFFLNTFRIPPEEWRAIRRKFRPDAVFCWHYAPGIRAPGYAPEHIAELCGMSIEDRSFSAAHQTLRFPDSTLPPIEMQTPPGPAYPLFAIRKSPDVRVFAEYADTGAAAAASTEYLGHRHWYLCAPVLKTPHYRRILESSGVHFHAPEGVTVYGDTRFLALFSRQAHSFALPFRTECAGMECISGGRFEKTATLPVVLDGKDARFFLFDEPASGMKSNAESEGEPVF